MLLLPSVSLLASTAFAGPLWARQSAGQTEANVDLSTQTGDPRHLASGLLYGIPDQPGAIPDEFIDKPRINIVRGGGLYLGGCKPGHQVPCDSVTTTDYQTMQRVGGAFVMLLNDMWAAWSSPTTLPGDGGDWSSFDSYLAAVIDAIKTHNMTDGLQIDLWNEPDWMVNWPQSQYIELYNRAYTALRSDNALSSVKLLAPASATPPGDPNAEAWWGPFLDNARTTNHVPDIYDWHLEGQGPPQPNNDPTQDMDAFAALLAAHGLPAHPPVSITEYGAAMDQQPAGAAWWIGRLERLNLPAMRGAWQPAGGLKDNLDDLLAKPGVPGDAGRGYWPNGEWQVHAYYGTNMTGARAATASSANGLLDVYATVGGGSGGDSRVRVLAGVRLATGAYTVAVSNLTAVGLPAAGTLAVRTLAFPFPGGVQGRVDAPTDEGVRTVAYSGDVLTLAIDQRDQVTAYAFEFDRAPPPPPGSASTPNAAATVPDPSPPTPSGPTATPSAPATAQNSPVAVPGRSASLCRRLRRYKGLGRFCR